MKECKKIALIAGNVQGGTIQFTTEFGKKLRDMGHIAYWYLPKEAKEYNSIDEREGVVFYEAYDKDKRFSRLNLYIPNLKKISTISKVILDKKPDVVIITDNGTFAWQLGCFLSNHIKVIMTLHDAGTRHLSDRVPISIRIRRFMGAIYSEILQKKADNILLLSPFSKSIFVKAHPKFADKVIVMPLGAHVPNVKECKPDELTTEDYYLFFGRIDKYKGLETLLRVYTEMDQADREKMLVIAGNGSLSNTEQNYCNSNKGIILINRYIKDEEMIYLIKHSRSIILPYIEATQSGVIPIAYKYNKPVITSNVEGLTQYVIDNMTGFICKTDEEYKYALREVCVDSVYTELQDSIKKYYYEQFDWSKNLDHMLDNIFNDNN